MAGQTYAVVACSIHSGASGLLLAIIPVHGTAGASQLWEAIWLSVVHHGVLRSKAYS